MTVKASPARSACPGVARHRGLRAEDIAAAAMSTKVQKIMTQPINLIFRFLQNKARIQVWLFENNELRIEGRSLASPVHESCA